MRRKLAARLALGLVLAGLGAGLARAGQQDPVPASRTIDDAMGPDDGYGLSLQCSGDFTAHLEPCGCHVPMGGLAWRSGYAKALEAKLGSKAAVLQVDAGAIFQAAYGPGYVQVDDLRLKNEWVLRACELLGMRAVNVTAADLPFLAQMSEASGYAGRVAEFPALDRFVSANVVPAGPSVRAFKPYVVEEVRAERFGAKPLRVGILGVTEIPRQGAAIAGYTIGDPFAALRKYAPEVRSKCDVLVVLAYLDRNALRNVESAAGSVDAVVAAHNYPLQLFDKQVEAPAYTFVATQAKAIGELRFYPAADGQPKRYGKVAMRYVVLTDVIPADPVATKLTLDAVKAFRRT